MLVSLCHLVQSSTCGVCVCVCVKYMRTYFVYWSGSVCVCHGFDIDLNFSFSQNCVHINLFAKECLGNVAVKKVIITNIYVIKITLIFVIYYHRLLFFMLLVVSVTKKGKTNTVHICKWTHLVFS